MSSVIRTVVKWHIPQAEYTALAAYKRSMFLESAKSAGHEKATETYAPGLVTREIHDARFDACESCQWRGEQHKCGCKPICGHELVKTMEQSKVPNYWLKSSCCPIGNWPEQYSK